MRSDQKAIDDVTHAVRVPKVLPHELLDRQQPFGALEAEGRGNAQLLGAVELVVGLAGGKVHLVAQPQQELERGALLLVVFAIQVAHQPQAVWIGIAVSGEADPAQQLDLAQPAGRTFDVGLEQVDRLAELPAFFAARLFDGRHQAFGPPQSLGAESDG